MSKRNLPATKTAVQLQRLLATTAVLTLIIGWSLPQTTASVAGTTTRRVNMPYFGPVAPGEPEPDEAIFWFGQVTPSLNYADVRAFYTDTDLKITVHVFDRLLWYNQAPASSDLTDWDAASLFINLDGNAGSAPGSNAYRFVAQLNHWQPRTDYQAAYQGNGSGWSPASLNFTTATGWRADGFNDMVDDRGWNVTFTIPYASLGLAGRPADGTTWGLALAVHDRDDAASTPIPDQIWPETMSTTMPSTWGQAGFGLPQQPHPASSPGGTTTIRQGLNGAIVPDAHVGGHTVCGDPYWPNYFDGWGDANYAGYTEINIQNQWDVADWPCFSKYYLTFPLEGLPAGQTIISATLTLHQFGSMLPAEPSWLQILTVAEEWDEGTITWNNAPLAVENVTGTWVEALPAFPGWPGVARHWDVTGPVTAAYAAGQPVRLAMYSSDGAYHSGKHFVSSDAGDWNAVARPTLRVLWGTPCTAVSTRCVYLPMAIR